MLRMPEFQVHLARSAAEALELRTSLPKAIYVAGGTDLLPNLKHQLHAPEHLVSLEHAGLAGVALDADGTLRIGAGTTLHAVATDETVRRELPGLARAASLVAGPQHRRLFLIRKEPQPVLRKPHRVYAQEKFRLLNHVSLPSGIR